MSPKCRTPEGRMEREKVIVLWKYHIDNQTVLLDHYSEVVTAGDLSWSRAYCG